MAPTHVSPGISKRIVLKEQVVFAVVEDQPIGVVRPITLRRKVNLRAVRLIIRLLLRPYGGRSSEQGYDHDDERNSGSEFHLPLSRFPSIAQRFAYQKRFALAGAALPDLF